MAKSQTTRPEKSTAPSTANTRLSPAEKVAEALKHASSQAKKQLALQGLKLPTQSWANSRVRNPMV